MYRKTINLLGILFVAGSSDVFAQAVPTNTGPVTTTTIGTTSGESKKIDLLQPLQQMISKIRTLQATGDPDFDFAFVTKVHIQGTQDLLKAIIETNPDSALTQVAKTMLSTAGADGATIAKLLRELKPTRPNAAFTKQQSRVIAAIQEKIKQSASRYKLTSSAEQNIAILLSDQRQDAMNLATGYLQFGKNTELRNFAQQSVEKAKLDMDIIKNLRKTSR